MFLLYFFPFFFFGDQLIDSNLVGFVCCVLLFRLFRSLSYSKKKKENNLLGKVLVAVLSIVIRRFCVWFVWFLCLCVCISSNSFLSFSFFLPLVISFFRTISYLHLCLICSRSPSIEVLPSLFSLLPPMHA